MLILLDGTGDESHEFVGVNNINFGRDKLAVILPSSLDENGVFAKTIPEIFKIFNIASMDTISSVTFLQSSEPLRKLGFFCEDFDVELAGSFMELFPGGRIQGELGVAQGFEAGQIFGEHPAVGFVLDFGGETFMFVAVIFKSLEDGLAVPFCSLATVYFTERKKQRREFQAG